MYIPLPFPYCSRCRRKHPYSYHHTPTCNGLLEIDPDTETVHCTNPLCTHRYWNIWDSTYYCDCGSVFNATQVKDAVRDLLEECRLCAEDLRLSESVYWKRVDMSNQSRRNHVSNTLRAIGYTAGVIAGSAFERLVDFIMDIFFRRR